MAQRVPKHKKFVASPKKDSTITNRKKQIAAQTTLVKVKGKTPAKSDKTPVNPQKVSKVAKAKIIRDERNAGVEPEKSLAEAQEFLPTTSLGNEHQTHIRRTSFIVRLMIDRDKQLGRTEIEHVPSGRRQCFLIPEGERLVTFMEECVAAVISPEVSIPMAPPAMAMDNIQESRYPKFHLVSLDVRVFRLENPFLRTLTLSHEEPIGIEICFQFQGSDARFLTVSASTYKIILYAHEMTSGQSRLLTTFNAKLTQEVLEYIVPLRAPGLPIGLYRLFTLITLDAPNRMGGFQRDIMIHVI